ncbi:molecular chaperone DnaK, partial [Mesorhizobium sp. M00.F.Ca.ET.186.01.1.1]
KDYMRKGEGKGNFLSYDEYEKQIEQREGRDDLV